MRNILTKSFWRSKLKEMFSTDLRSLALYRIGLGVVMLADLATRVMDLSVFYTDAGLAPRSLVLSSLPKPYAISIHMISGSLPSQVIIFTLHAAFAILLLVGYRTRLMTILCWFFTMSLDNRTQVVLGA